MASREISITVTSGFVPCNEELAKMEYRTEAYESTVTIKVFDEIIHQSKVRHSNQFREKKDFDQMAVLTEISHQLHWLAVKEKGVLDCKSGADFPSSVK